MTRSLAMLVSICLMILISATVRGQSAAPRSSQAGAQAYPTKPIRILASEPGAVIDLTARLLVPGLSASLGQPVIVENRASSGYQLPELGLKALPDGYTLLIQGGSFWVAPLMTRAPYEPLKDFTPVTMATNAPLFLFINPAVPAKTIKEFVALAKAKPGELNYGSSGAGGTGFLAAELFKHMAGVDIVRIPYKGTGQATIGLLANQVQAVFASAAAGMVHVKSGKLRVLGVANAQPSPIAPEVPTIAAAGVPGYEAGQRSAILVPGKTPKAIVIRLNHEIVQALGAPSVKEKLMGSGVETVGDTPEQAYAYIKSDMAKMGKVIKDTGAKAD